MSKKTVYVRAVPGGGVQIEVERHRGLRWFAAGMFAIVTVMALFQGEWGTVAFSFLLAAVCLPRQHRAAK